MILTGPEIQKRIDLGQLKIEPFNKDRINPNSYNLSLHNELIIYKNKFYEPNLRFHYLDIKKQNETKKVTIPEDGLILSPGILYLGRTVELTETHGCVPMIEGRSSLGRLGMFVHITAGFGDVGFNGHWTLEISVIHPIRIYPGIEVCQIFYHDVVGDIIEYKSDKYQNNKGIQASMMHKDFK